MFSERRMKNDTGTDPSTCSKISEKNLKIKKLKSLYKEAIEMICEDYSIGEEKTGDLAGMYGYDIYYNKTNYELAYRVRQLDDLIIIIIMAGTRENFYEELKRYIRTI